MATINLQLLGGLTILDQQQATINLTVKKAKSLLAYLAMQPGETISRDHLAQLLWPNKQKKQARHSLRQSLADLRKHLPQFEACVEINHSQLQVIPDTITVDALEFEQLARSTNSADQIAAYERYSGPFLDGFTQNSKPYLLWLEEISLNLHERFLAVLEFLTEHYLLEGKTDQAIDICQELLKLDPIRESAHRHLMAIYAKQGVTKKVTAQYRQCCNILKEKFKSDPERQTIELYQRLLDLNADQQFASTLQGHAVKPSNDTPTIRFDIPGFETQSQTINTTIEKALTNNTGHCFTIFGDEWSGKSWYLAQIESCFNDSGYQLIKCRCYDPIKYTRNPLRDVIMQLTSGLDSNENEIDLPKSIVQTYYQGHPKSELYLAALHLLIESVIPKRLNSIFTALDHKQRESLPYLIVTDLVQKQSAKRPIVLLVDDIDHAQQCFTRNFENLINSCQSRRIFIFCTGGKPLSTSKELNTVITQLDIDHRSESGGLLLASWQDELGLPREEKLLLEKFMVQLVEQLTEKDRSALNAAAILGETFAENAWFTMIDNPHYSPEPLIESGFLKKEQGNYVFRHGIIQKQLYLNLHHDIRSNYHSKAAAFYLFGDIQQYARHLAEAGSPDTVHAYISAALSATDDFRYELAIQLFDKAEQYSSKDSEHFYSALQRGLILLDLKRIAQAIQAFQKAQQHARTEHQKSMTWFGMAIGLYHRQQYNSAQNLIDRCEAGIIHEADHKQQTKYYFYRALISRKLKQPAEAMRYTRIAYEHARQVTENYCQAGITILMGKLELDALLLSKAYNHFENAIRLSRDEGYGDLELRALLLLSEVKLLQADLQGAANDLEHTLKLASITNNHRTILDVQSQLCLIDFYRGQYARLQQHSELATELSKLANDATMQNHLENFHLYSLHRLSKKEEFDLQLKAIRHWVDQKLEAPSYNLGPILALVEDDKDRARLYLSNSLTILAELNGPSALECCFLCIEAAIQHKLWEILLEFADRLIIIIRHEPLPFYIMCAERARVLSQMGQGHINENTRVEVVDLLTSAKQIGLLSHMNAYEAALEKLRHEPLLHDS